MRNQNGGVGIFNLSVDPTKARESFPVQVFGNLREPETTPDPFLGPLVLRAEFADLQINSLQHLCGLAHVPRLGSLAQFDSVLV